MRRRAGLLLGILVSLIPLLAPAGPEFTPVQRRMAAATLLMAVWWITEAIPIPVTALVPLVAFPLLGIMSSRETAPAYGDHLVFLFLGGFLIASAMEKWKLHRRIAVLTIAMIGAGPRRILLGFMLATAFLSMWISNTATTLMMVPIAAAVVMHLSEGSLESGVTDERRAVLRREMGAVLMMGIAYAASIGGIGTLVGTPPNIVFSGSFARLFPDQPEITFVQWMGIGIPFVVVTLPLAAFVVWRFGGKIPTGDINEESARQLVQEEKLRLGSMSTPEKIVLAIFAATAILWITRRPVDLGGVTVPGWSSVFPWSSGIHDATVAMAMALLLFIIRVRDLGTARTQPLLNWDEAAAKVPWGILLLFGGGFALASGFRSTGLDEWIGGHLVRVAEAPLPLVVLCTCLLTTFLTEVTSNTATATLLMPVVASVAVQAGLDPKVLMVPAALAASCAFMLPVATPPNAIVFGSGWLSIPRMARTGLILNLVTAVVITVIVLTLGRSVF